MADRGRGAVRAGPSGGGGSGVTGLLRRWSAGDREALGELAPLVEGELRRVAHAYLRRERPGHTLETGALINEAYARLLAEQDRGEGGGIAWEGRGHFYGIAARVMRQVLVEHARRRRAAKRAGTVLPLDEEGDAGERAALDPERVLGLHEALEALERLDVRQGRIVELMFFGGLTGEEIAEALGVSPATVKRQWRLARAWLRRRMSGER